MLASSKQTGTQIGGSFPKFTPWLSWSPALGSQASALTCICQLQFSARTGKRQWYTSTTFSSVSSQFSKEDRESTQHLSFFFRNRKSTCCSFISALSWNIFGKETPTTKTFSADTPLLQCSVYVESTTHTGQVSEGTVRLRKPADFCLLLSNHEVRSSQPLCAMPIEILSRCSSPCLNRCGHVCS